MGYVARRRDRPSEVALAAEVKIKRADETLINPATQETLSALNNKKLTDTELARLIQYSIPRTPTWINGSNTTAPTTTTDLITRTVSTGMTGRILGWQIISPEANEFILNIGAIAYRIGALASAGVIIAIFDRAIFDSIAAGIVINIRVAVAGGAGKIYRVDLLYDEA